MRHANRSHLCLERRQPRFLRPASEFRTFLRSKGFVTESERTGMELMFLVKHGASPAPQTTPADRLHY